MKLRPRHKWRLCGSTPEMRQMMRKSELGKELLALHVRARSGAQLLAGPQAVGLEVRVWSGTYLASPNYTSVDAKY